MHKGFLRGYSLGWYPFETSLNETQERSIRASHYLFQADGPSHLLLALLLRDLALAVVVEELLAPLSPFQHLPGRVA